ncbi:MinD/ParA family protein [Desertihabitans brevis]|uniref:MinD/ParA family protein n=1 Tax=Desertihabitans brevis TaxID=2268447 RepID=A0A367YUU0_9ACTN|nr:AAA family ATPase [Desertihabitans brevis]RCK69299.1 MinD/ParA family protein [Desertihabitans brevis]
MTRTLLLSGDEPLVRTVREVTAGDVVVLPGRPLAADPGPLRAVLDSSAAEVLLLDARDEPGPALGLARAVVDQHPGVAVVLVAEASAELALAALRAGVRDVVAPDAGLPELAAALERAGRAASPGPAAGGSPLEPGTAGRVISVVSPKGGVGKTTVATNLAVGLARRWPGSTVLVDLDIQFGDVASALDLEPEHYLGDAVTGPARRDSMALKTVLTRHPTGLHVICAPDSPADADAVTESDVTHLLQVLATEFRYVVVDTAPGLSEHTLSALDQTTDLVLLASMDVPAVRGLRKEIDTLARLELLPPSRHVVINFTDRRSLLTIADVEFTIGTAVDLQLPRSKAAPDSVDQGVPLLQSGVKDPMTTQLHKLLERLAGPDGAAPVPVQTDPAARKGKRAASRWRRTRAAVA